jgi:UDP-N-acetylmuramate--alanine ligase
LAALAVARNLNISDQKSFKALSEYKGSWRRFDQRKTVIGNKKIDVILDYGHHPTEIRVTLKAIKEKFPKRKVWCIFQAHQYQRTHYLWNDFIKTFKTTPVDETIITDIYDVVGRENKKYTEKVSAEKLVQAIKKSNTIYIPKKEIINYLKEKISEKDVIIVMGAGDLYKLFI